MLALMTQYRRWNPGRPMLPSVHQKVYKKCVTSWFNLSSLWVHAWLCMITPTKILGMFVLILMLFSWNVGSCCYKFPPNKLIQHELLRLIRFEIKVLWDAVVIGGGFPAAGQMTFTWISSTVMKLNKLCEVLFFLQSLGHVVCTHQCCIKQRPVFSKAD